MPFQIDHVVIAVSDLARAVADYRALGFTVLEGGVHASDATHNALIGFADGTYLELLASTGRAARLRRSISARCCNTARVCAAGRCAPTI